MRKKYLLGVLVIIIFHMVIQFAVSGAFAGNIDNLSPEEALTTSLGFVVIFPPLIAIALAFITKNVIISLFLGAMAGTFIISVRNQVAIGDINILKVYAGAFFGFIEKAISSLAQRGNSGIILQIITIGGLVYLVGKMGGAKAIAEKLAKRAKSPVSAQLITWFMGLLVFFDDYANALIIGPMMRPIFDKMKISREKLAFIVDSTAAPVAGIAIISTWIGHEVTMIRNAYEEIGVFVDGFGIFVQTIPYRFYNIFMLIFIIFIAVTSRDFGPMLTAEISARKGEHTKGNNGQESLDALEPDKHIVPKIYNAAIPIAVLIVTALCSFYFTGINKILAGNDLELIQLVTNSPFSAKAIMQSFNNTDTSIALFQSALLASIVAILMAVYQQMYNLAKTVSIWIDGMKSLLVTAIILILAWSLSSVIKDLGTAKFLTGLLSEHIHFAFLPSIIFILGSLISFSTGTAYGTITILMPLAVSLGNGVNSEPYFVTVCTGAVLTGAIFGDHCSPISDTTILSSMGADCDHIEHVRTQMPYALLVGGLTVILGYIPAAFNVPPIISVVASCVAMFTVLRVFGKKASAFI